MRYTDVIFDFGNVLAVFSPKNMVAARCSDAVDACVLERTVFDRAIWDRLDDGSIDNAQATDAIIKALPEHLKSVGKEIFLSWMDFLPETDGIRELVVKLKKNGCRVFVLSNISRDFSLRSSNIPILSLFDGAVYSADIGIVKPDKRIFSYICEKYSIEASSALFIDDSELNTNAAKSFGLDTWLFKFDVPALTDYIFS